MSRGFNTVSVGRPTRLCAATGRSLAIGEKYLAAIYEPPRAADDRGTMAGEVPLRRDYSFDACPGGRPPIRDGLIACWRTVVGEPGKKDKPLLDDDALVDLFEQTGGEETAHHPAAGSAEFHRCALRFVVTLMLLRRRLLIQEGQKGDVLLIRQRGIPRAPEGPPPLKVLDPGLDEQMVLDIITQLETGGVASEPQPVPEARGPVGVHSSNGPATATGESAS